MVEQLRAMNQLDNTVVLFLSDNGASAEQIIRGDGHDSLGRAWIRPIVLMSRPGLGKCGEHALPSAQILRS